MAELTPKQRKTFAKITEALQEFPFGATIQDLYNEARLSMTVITNALEKMDNVEQRGDSWFLKSLISTPAGEAVEPTIEQPVMQDGDSSAQDKPVNMQDGELNTQAPHIILVDNDGATLINTSATLINTSATLINTSAEVVSPSDIDTDADQSSNGQAIETAPVAENEEEFELQPPPIATKHYVLIENCTLSLAQDGTGQEPVLAKDIWVDDEGEELEESDCQVMKRAREPFNNQVEFRGVTYRNLFIVNNAQIFHGVFDCIKAANDKLEELTAKKRDNLFQVLEV